MTALTMTIRPLLVLTLLTPQNGDLQARATKLITTFLSGNQTATMAMLKGGPPIEQLVQARGQLLNAVGAFESVTQVKVAPFQGMQVSTVSCAFAKGTADLTVTFDPAGDIAGFRIISVKPKTVPWETPPYADSKKFSERQLTLGSAPWELPATLTMPTGTGPFPAVVLVHGSGPQDEDESIQANKPFKDLAWGLASKGIAVLRYQKRTAVYGREMVSLNLTVMDETVDDARAAIALLGKTEGINPKRIYVVGQAWAGCSVKNRCRNHCGRGCHYGWKYTSTGRRDGRAAGTIKAGWFRNSGKCRFDAGKPEVHSRVSGAVNEDCRKRSIHARIVLARSARLQPGQSRR